jgi:L-gulonolactone oxidase
VKASDAYASMMYGEDTMMIELIMVLGSRKGRDLLAHYESALEDLGVRSHWGQYNRLTPERVRAAYPKWDEWLAVRRRFNATGVFDSEFTDRVGISGRAARRPAHASA